MADLSAGDGSITGGTCAGNGSLSSDPTGSPTVTTSPPAEASPDPSPARPEWFGSRLIYLPGLDGLRAIAVILVLIYHSEVPWLPGGFLGVEVFFVISGYLITSLLLQELANSGRIDFFAFWLRRSRRLFPAAFALIIGVLIFAVLLLPGEVAKLRTDALASFAYVSNWYLILDQQSYFESVGRPSLLQHLWSLAVEWQFYLAWPLLFALAARFLPRRRMALVAMAFAAGSVLLMAALYQPDADPSRIYYGSDTRAGGLFAGAALAFLVSPMRPVRPLSRIRVWLLDAAGIAALGALGYLCLQINEYQPFLYRGGFLAVALATALAIAVAVDQRGRFGRRVLGWRPLGWIGLRSYSIYLWHWPVFMVTRPQLDLRLDGVPLAILRLAATLALAELSYRFVEVPARRGAMGRAWKRLRDLRVPGNRRWGLLWAGAGTATVLCLTWLGAAMVSAKDPAPPSYLSVEAVQTTPSPAGSPVVAPAEQPDAVATGDPHTGSGGVSGVLEMPENDVSSISGMQEAGSLSDASEYSQNRNWSFTLPFAEAIPAATPTATAVAASIPVPGVHVTAIGDSVMVGAAKDLEQALPRLDVDAAVGRQAAAGIKILQARRSAGTLGDVVVVHLGSNGPLSAGQFDQMMKELAHVRRVVVVNVKVPRQWEAPNNAVLAEGVKRYSNAVLADWKAASDKRPELFWNDGIHLRPAGAKVYADLIASLVNTPLS